MWMARWLSLKIVVEDCPTGRARMCWRQKPTGGQRLANTVEPGTTRAAAGPSPSERRPAKPPGRAPMLGRKGVPPDLYLVRKVWMMPRLVSCRAHTYTLNTSLDRLSGYPVNRLMEPIHP